MKEKQEKKELAVGVISLSDKCCRTCQYGWMKRGSETRVLCRHPDNQVATRRGSVSRIHNIHDRCELWEINSFLG